jgi:phenylpropionate dioxygenase-like ring-hydroxylating dioxygenase large terminal subunit
MTMIDDATAGRTGSMLRDGTTPRDLIDLDRREVSMRVLSDPELYRLELQNIFARAWVALAHVSEIPSVGDFVMRYIGEDPVIVTRTPQGKISVLLNVCAHRGFEICRAEEGNSSSFKCPYHGWAFDASGNLLGAPLEKEMYGDWDKTRYGLRRARVEVRAGIVFATFDPSGLPLDDWLGDTGWYIDRASHEDRIPLGPPMRFLVRGNWKTFMDQGAGDNYHPLTLHRSLQEIGMTSNLPGGGGSRATIRSQNHVIVSVPEGNTTFAFPAGFPLKNVFDENADDFLAFEGRLFASSVFPQSVIWGPYSHLLPDGTETTGGSLWQIEPKGPDTFMMFLQNFIDRNAPDEVKDAVRREYAAQQVFVADDYEANQSLQRSARGAVGQQQPLRYFAQGDRTKPSDWPGPGTFLAPPQKDDAQWTFWLRWLDLMTVGAR